MEWIKFLLDVADDVEKVYGKSLAYEFVVSVLDFIDTKVLVTTGDAKLDLLANVTGLYLLDEKVLEGEGEE
jgi:hypothetical protein